MVVGQKSPSSRPSSAMIVTGGCRPNVVVWQNARNMVIELLSEHIGVIPTLSEWYQSTWEPYYGINGPGDARADLESRCNHDQLPIGLVAIEDNQVLGTAALALDVTTNLTPSIVGLLVGTAYGRRGIATALLGTAEELAGQLGYRRLYVSTTVLGDLLNRFGWKAMGEVQFLNAEQGSVYVRDL